MPLPPPLEALWTQLESVRREVLEEVDGLSQSQADWRPGEEDWSIGEIVHHLTLAEVGTGKLTSKLLKESPQPLPPFPADLGALRPLPPPAPTPMQAPDPVRPQRGQPIAALLADFKAARERSRQTFERLGQVDPRGLRWRHFSLGEMDITQWWMLQARHDGDHLGQLRSIKAAPGFPRA